MSEDNQAEEIETSAPEPKPEPLFTLDLGANGGVLAPTSYAELRAWLDREVGFWSWSSSYRYNSNSNSPEFWLNLQRNYDLAVAVKAVGGLDAIKPVRAA